MGHRQKGKGSKRRKSWHRGRGEAHRWDRISRRLPDLGTGATPADCQPPTPLRRDSGPSRLHGDTA